MMTVVVWQGDRIACYRVEYVDTLYVAACTYAGPHLLTMLGELLYAIQTCCVFP